MTNKYDNKFLTDYFKTLESLESQLNIVKKNIKSVDSDTIVLLLNDAYDKIAFVERNIEQNRGGYNNGGCHCCHCCNKNNNQLSDSELVDAIIRLKDVIKDLVKELEANSLKEEFTARMIRPNSNELFERKLGFLVNEKTYNKLVDIFNLYELNSLTQPKFNLVVKHPAFPYTMIATLLTKDIETRLKSPKPVNYNSAYAPYLYLDIEDFKYDDITGLHVENFSDHYSMLSFFTFYGANFKSTIVDLTKLKDVPTTIYGEESVVASITDKDLSLHEYLKFVDTKELATSSYNDRYFVVKYENGWLLKDKSVLSDEALYIVKDENLLTKFAEQNNCKCRHPVRKYY